MSSSRINKYLNTGTYFLTFSVKNLYYVFDRHDRWEILASCLSFYQKKRNIYLVSFVFMLNHIHLIIQGENILEFVRDFKKYTSRQLHKNIKLTEPNILKLFVTDEGTYEFWTKTNSPKLIETEGFFNQKLQYIENNPVKKGYVMSSEYWYWSSANPYCELKSNHMWIEMDFWRT